MSIKSKKTTDKLATWMMIVGLFLLIATAAIIVIENWSFVGITSLIPPSYGMNPGPFFNFYFILSLSWTRWAPFSLGFLFLWSGLIIYLSKHGGRTTVMTWKSDGINYGIHNTLWRLGLPFILFGSIVCFFTSHNIHGHMFSLGIMSIMFGLIFSFMGVKKK